MEVFKDRKNVTQNSGTMETISEIRRKSELKKEGKLSKDNLKEAINREKQTKSGDQESSDKERTRERKMPGGEKRISCSTPRTDQDVQRISGSTPKQVHIEY